MSRKKRGPARLYRNEGKRITSAADLVEALKGMSSPRHRAGDAGFDAPKRAIESCNEMERYARALLRDHGVADEPPALPPGWIGEPGFPRDDDAPQAVVLARSLLNMLPRLYRLATDEPELVQWAIECGAKYERMRANHQFGALAETGRDSIKGGRKGADLLHGEVAERDVQTAELRAAYVATRAKYPELLHVDACRRVAHDRWDDEAQWQRVYRAVPNPQRSRRGRPRK